MIAFDAIFLGAVLCAVPASYLSNFGIFRAFLAILCVPYYLAFAVVNGLHLVACARKSMWNQITFLASGATYLGANLALHDCSALGACHAFFGTIEFDHPPEILKTIFVYSLLVQACCLVLMVVQIVLAARSDTRRVLAIRPRGIERAPSPASRVEDDE